MNLNDKITVLKLQAMTTDKTLNALLAGKTVRFIRDFRDQPYGHSKPSQLGKLAVIRNAWIEAHDGHAEMFLEGYSCSVELDVDAVLIDGDKPVSKKPKCQECDSAAARHHDPRTPPLDDGDCLCGDCFEMAKEMAIEDLEGRIAALRNMQ